MKLSRLITIPLALIIIVLAIANRRIVPLALDPFSSERPVIALEVPLWAAIFSAFVLGFLLGGVTMWTTRMHRRLRRSLQRRAWARAEKRAARAREDDPLAGLPMIKPAPGSLAPPRRTLLGRKSEPPRAA